MSKISAIKGRPILDSRGEWTLEVSLSLDSGVNVIASVPQGKSKGSYEAVAVNPERSVEIIDEFLASELILMDPRSQSEIDGKMIELDGTTNMSKIGSNTSLAVSIACVRAAAVEAKIPLWKYMRSISKQGDSKKFPRLYVNVINGGLHAGNNLNFQEYMIIPKSGSLTEDIRTAHDFYAALRDYLVKEKGQQAANLGDEGGFAPEFISDIEPFEVLDKVRASLGLKDKIDFGMDAAASGIEKTPAELAITYVEIENKFGLYYLEDPFKEDDFESFKKLKEALNEKTIVAGDDLTVTNPERIKTAKYKEAINGIIIKPNQIGTVSQAIEAVNLAKEAKWTVVVSHRSGETNDDFIADFAYGIGADGIKLGSPARGERIAKYDRLLAIEKEIQTP